MLCFQHFGVFYVKNVECTQQQCKGLNKITRLCYPFQFTLYEVEEITETLKIGLLVKGITLSTSPSSGINLKEQIKDLMYVNRVEVRATCIRPYQGDWYTSLDTQTLAPEKTF